MSKQPSAKLKVGTAIRVREGISVPELPDFSCAGWSGTVLEVRKKKDGSQFIIEWDDPTLEQKMPAAYQQQCEEQGLFFRMACLTADDIEPLE